MGLTDLFRHRYGRFYWNAIDKPLVRTLTGGRRPRLDLVPKQRHVKVDIIVTFSQEKAAPDVDCTG
ncbi:MAG TPA: hypothetical protein VHO25_10345 [Polyangiaceae bacterium]|nr:hypothetical protein [Polyangiaceae bacterium]